MCLVTKRLKVGAIVKAAWWLRRSRRVRHQPALGINEAHVGYGRYSGHMRCQQPMDECPVAALFFRETLELVAGAVDRQFHRLEQLFGLVGQREIDCLDLPARIGVGRIVAGKDFVGRHRRNRQNERNGHHQHGAHG